MIKVNGIDMTEFVVTQKLSEYASQEDIFTLAVVYMASDVVEGFREPVSGLVDYTLGDLLKNTTDTDLASLFDDIFGKFASKLGIFDQEDRAQFIRECNIHCIETITGKTVKKPETWVDAVEKASNEVTAPASQEYLPNQWYEASHHPENAAVDVAEGDDEGVVILRIPQDFSDDETDLILALFELIGAVRERKEHPIDALLASNDFFITLNAYETKNGITQDSLNKLTEVAKMVINA